jgi:hypothetical protein
MDALPRVFIPIKQEDKFNTSACEQYGERVFLLQADGPSVFNTLEVLAVFEFELDTQGFDPLVDYIALTGPTIFVALFYALAHRKYPQIKTLLFDARKSQYNERVVRIGRPGAGGD